MPYIAKKKRNCLTEMFPETDGELNWAITSKIDEYIKEKGLSYSTLNSVVGVLECAKLELYRRIAAGYEDKKCVMNGDVYTCDERRGLNENSV